MTNEQDTDNPTSCRRILLASIGALLVAIIALFTVVLPAEYGYDPLGTGKALGLTALNDHQTGVLNLQPRAWQHDDITFQLAPFEALEYKYRLAKDSAMVFHWRANAELVSDLHAEPDDAAPDYAKSFIKARVARQSGSYVAPFNGIHGWFWQNRTEQEVTLNLSVSGFLSESVELRDGVQSYYRIEDNRRKRQP